MSLKETVYDIVSREDTIKAGFKPIEERFDALSRKVEDLSLCVEDERRERRKAEHLITNVFAFLYAMRLSGAEQGNLDRALADWFHGQEAEEAIETAIKRLPRVTGIDMSTVHHLARQEAAEAIAQLEQARTTNAPVEPPEPNE
jgi:hypothetical protein